MKIRRTLALSGAVLGATLVVTGAVAFACTNLATLNLSNATGKPGDTITVTGSSFRLPAGVPAVQVHWNGVDGPVLAEAVPDRVGNIAATFTVPQAAPDNYVIVATLRDAKGNDSSGTPARAQFQIVGGAGKSAPAAVSAQQPVSVGSSGSSAAPVALLVILGVAGLGLFGAGFVAFARQARRRDVAVPAAVRKD